MTASHYRHGARRPGLQQIRKLCLLSLGIMLGLSGCATAQKPIAEETRLEMAKLYECVWYLHLNGEEEKSTALLDEAVETGDAAGLDGNQIMQVYSATRKTQVEQVAKEAQIVADKRGRSVKRIIAGDPTPVEPTEAEANAALLKLYHEQCSSF